ncbi:MAG: hypothetical protein QOG48_1275 [Verrucomicrobiota bacterium]|jgi:undecaprenyl-diphosphatase
MTPQSTPEILALANPFGTTDTQIASWFHAHLTPAFVAILRVLCEPGASEFIAIVLTCLVAVFLWKRQWPSLITLVIAVPGGMLLNELVKILVHRQRPFVDGPFVDWAGYSFASGHTIGATLLWGQLLLFALPLIRSRRVRRALICIAAVIVLLVGFSRIALGAHYFTDVVAAMLFGSGWLALCSTASRSFRRRTTPLAVEIVSELAPVPVAVEAIPNE